MKKAPVYLSLMILLFVFGNCSYNQSPQSEKAGPRFQNNILSYLSEAAAKITDNSLSEIISVKDWEKTKEQKLNEFIEMMGVQDYYYNERTDLNVKLTGTIQRDGYRIEKLQYESLPGLYVPAHLYIPDNIVNPAAAILYVNGHSPTQNVRYQHYPSKFAELGFVCLIIETIQFGEVYGHHHGCYANGWFNWYSRGYNPGGVELWNAIRGLDLLASRPEVDAERMGVTGISGGGSQSWYIAAADSRIKAVAPVCGASTLKAHIEKRTVDGHCDCMMPTNTYLADFQNIGALIAPRPLLIAQADRDGMNTIESIRELHSDIKKLYDLYGESDKISLVETPGGHSYHQISREKIHSFFIKHLMGKDVSPEEAGDVDLSKENLLTAEELKVYTEGIPENDRTPTIQDSFVKLAGDPVIQNEDEFLKYSDWVKKSLLEKTFGAFPEVESPLDAKMEFRSSDGGKFGWNIYSFVPEEGWRLKVDFHWRTDTTVRKPLMIVLKNYDEDRWGAESFSSGLDQGYNIAYFEARGIGETGWDPALQWHVRRASAWTGRTIASMQVYDILRCIEFCRTLPQVDPDKISIAAKNEMTVMAMYAALLDGQCEHLVLKNPPATQDVASEKNGKGEAIEMLNCLRFTDVYQLPAIIIPTQTTFIGKVPDTYNWSETLLRKLGKLELRKVEEIKEVAATSVN
jgi:cephalosporin-C deacetylase-like acetyl esterase